MTNEISIENFNNKIPGNQDEIKKAKDINEPDASPIIFEATLNTTRILENAGEMDSLNHSPIITNFQHKDSQGSECQELNEIQGELGKQTDLESENNKFKCGRWTKEEQVKFIHAIFKYGNDWKKVQECIISRSSTQARSHAQKFFLRMKKLLKMNSDNECSFENFKLKKEFILNCIRNCTHDKIECSNEEIDRLIKVLLNFNSKRKPKVIRDNENEVENESSHEDDHSNFQLFIGKKKYFNIEKSPSRFSLKKPKRNKENFRGTGVKSHDTEDILKDNSKFVALVDKNQLVSNGFITTKLIPTNQNYNFINILAINVNQNAKLDGNSPLTTANSTCNSFNFNQTKSLLSQEKQQQQTIPTNQTSILQLRNMINNQFLTNFAKMPQNNNNYIHKTSQSGAANCNISTVYNMNSLLLQEIKNFQSQGKSPFCSNPVQEEDGKHPDGWLLNDNIGIECILN
jgi:SHAQKYF class myb-like DNA-binding protein